ncbi:acyl carrier protein [Streptomyces sp. me109]|uniref:acyl carrier protein n=1 Tax=Streptomyces sp. me109 TaxID=1827853 RepID=UPI0011CD7884|nr:acyl carrier protein [Streptomyces sp. me109]TXS54685.1 acyl carrier protein [Streptomyces sp. me109]
MTSAPDPRTACPTPAADVLAELTAVLAGMMGVEPQRLDAQDSFRLLGLDSMLSVEFVAALNARYGTRIAATALYEHPTPAALARHLAAELAAPAPASAFAPAPATAPVSAGSSVPGADTVTDTLRTQLAGILHCAVRDIDVSAPFDALGLDSILAAEFLAGINRTYGLSEQTDLLYDHPDLAAMAAYVTARVTDTPVPAAGRADRAPDPAQPPRAVEIDLNALLDAVRDEVLSIDEAAALLAARSA